MPVKSLIPELQGTAVLVPGSPGAPGGPGGVSSAFLGSGWEVGVYSAASNFSTLLCMVPTRAWNSFTFSKLLNDKGSGTLTLNMDDPFWNTSLVGNLAAHFILDEEHCFRVFQDGIARFDFLGETITEQLVDPSESRLATITGPGTIHVLTFAMAAPPGFPSTIVYKADALADDFSAVNGTGQYIIDFGLWNASANTGSISVNPAGSAQLTGTSGGTVLGSDEWDFTNTLFSVQMSPIVSPDQNNVTLNGSELTQMYLESLDGNGYYVMIAMSSTSLYAQYKGPNGVQTQVIATAAQYAANMSATFQYSYWQISEANGTFFFWTSPDGQTWTKGWQTTREWDSSKVGVFFATQYTGSTTEFATVTSINSDVVTSSLGGATYLNQPIMGIYLQTLLAAEKRGTIPYVITQLNTATDSFGTPWSDSQSVQIQNGTDLYSLLQGHTSMVDADYIMEPGFKLVVGLPAASTPNPGQVTLGYDRSKVVRFYEAERSTMKTRQRQRNQIQNLLAVINSDSVTVTTEDAPSAATWGQREAWVQAASQVSAADLNIVASAAAQQNADEILSWTLQIVPQIVGRTVFKDFAVGDWIGLERPDFSAVDAVRVVGITISIDQDGNETDELILVSYVAWLEQRLQYIATKMGGGYVSANGTTAIADNAQGSTLQAPTVFSQSLSSLGIPQSSGGAPLVYNPTTGQWVAAGSIDPTTGNEVPLSVAGNTGSTTVGQGGIQVTTPQPGVTPLNLNPTFSSGGSGSTASWVGSNATITTQAPSAGLPSQAFVCKITPTSAGAVSLVQSSTANAAVQAGQAYTLFAYVFMPTQANMGITTEISWFNSKGVLIQTDALSTPIPASQWVQLSYQDTAPANSVTAKVAVGPTVGVIANPAQAGFVALVQGTSTAGAAASSTAVTPAGTTVTDANGNVRIVTGLQSDGTTTTNYFNGLAPATPDTPTVTAALLGLQVSWDGLLAGAAPLSDFLLMQVHVSTSSGFTPSSGTLYTVMTVAGNVNVAGLTAGTTYFVKLVAVNESGTASAASTQASGVPTTVPANIPSGGITSIMLAVGVAGAHVSISATAPGSPATGDLWYASTAGFELNQWSGSAWVPVQYGTNAISAGAVTAALIAANTITAAQIASGTITALQISANTITASQIAANTITATQIASATITGTQIAATTITAANIASATITAAKLVSGIIVAGIVDSTTIMGATIIADGTTGEFLAYSGTPTTGNLVLSISPTSGTDAHSNPYPAGVGIFNSSTAFTTLSASTAGNLVLGTGSAGGGGLELVTQTTTPGSSNSIFYADANGSAAYRNGSSGWNGQLLNCRTDTTNITNTTASYVALTTAWSIPAGDAVHTTTYRLTCWGTGATSGGTLPGITFQGLIGATAQGTAVISAANLVGSGTTNYWKAELIVSVTAAGSSGTAQFTLSVGAGAGTGSGGFVTGGSNGPQTFNTTIANTLQIQGHWITGATSVSLVCYGSQIERLGA